MALKNGLLEGKGTLLVFEPPHASRPGRDFESVFVDRTAWGAFVRSLQLGEPNALRITLKRAEECIPAALWDPRLYDWQESCLRSPWSVQPHACFRSVCVKTEQISAALNGLNTPFEVGRKRDESPDGSAQGKASVVEKSLRSVRSASYDWEAFHVEIIAIANEPDGLPAAQAELVRRMASWCEENWGKQPADSTLKEKISVIYRRIAQRQ